MAWGYSSSADSIQSGIAAQGEGETALMKVQAWAMLLTYTAITNIRKREPLSLIMHHNVAKTHLVVPRPCVPSFTNFTDLICTVKITSVQVISQFTEVKTCHTATGENMAWYVRIFFFSYILSFDKM